MLSSKALLLFVSLLNTSLYLVSSQPASSWASVASSGNGQFICAGAYMQSIYCSYDAGSSWFKTVSPALTWASLAMSTEGDFVVAVPSVGNIYTSTTFGDTWKITSSDTYGTWNSVDCDTTGKYVVAVSSATIIAVSSNFGHSWTYLLKFPSQVQFHGVTSDATGQYIIAVGLSSVYYSNDFGETFNKSRTDLTNVFFAAVCSDETGQYALAAASNGIYRTQTYGRIWQIAYTANYNWGSIALNSPGEVAFAGTDDGGLYRSTDGGLSWDELDSLPTQSYWADMAIDESSNNVVAAVDGGALYTSSNGGITWEAHLTSCEVGTSYDSVTGDCEYCCLDGTNACTLYNDGSMISCKECPEFQLSFGDHATCTNPCSYPFVPAYGTDASYDINYTCEELNVQAPVIAWSLVVVVIAGCYLLNLVLVEQHVARYRPFVPAIVILTTAVPVLEYLSLWLFLLLGTFDSKWILIGTCLCVCISPMFLMLRMLHRKRRDANIVPVLFLVPSCFANWEIFDGIQSTSTLCLQCILMLPTLLINSIWLIPMLGLLFILFATHLHTYGPLYNAWFHRWSGRTDLYEKEQLLSVAEFVESRVISVLFQSLPMVCLLVYNRRHVQSVDTPHPSMILNLFALIMALLSTVTLFGRYLLVSLRTLCCGTRGICFESPELISISPANDPSANRGRSNSAKKLAQVNDGMGHIDSKDFFPISYPPKSRSKSIGQMQQYSIYSIFALNYWLDLYYVNDPEADLEAYKRRTKSGRFSLLYSADNSAGKDLLGRPVPSGKTQQEMHEEEEAEELAAEEELRVEELRLRGEVDNCIARNRAKWQAFRQEIRRSMVKIEDELYRRIEAQTALAAAAALIHMPANSSPKRK